MDFIIRKISVIGFIICFIFCACPRVENRQDPIATATPFVLSTPFYFPKFKIPTDNPLTKEGIELGRSLFYEKKLSVNNDLSCGSCHKQELAFADGKAFSKGFEGKLGLRSSMSLANLVVLDSLFFWDGRSHSLEHQALFPIQDPLEMNQSLEQTVQKLKNDPNYPAKFKIVFGNDSITPVQIAKAISQFERTLISTDSKYDRSLLETYQLSPQEKKGKDLFYQHPFPESRKRGGNCGDCHGGVLQTFNRMQNNGLDKNFADLGYYSHTKIETDKGKFRAPSLRNIAVTAPYMHDGRFKTLEEVLEHYNEHIDRSLTTDILLLEATNNIGAAANKLGLTDQEKKDIIVFLHTLTDSTFLTNPAFRDPNK